MICLTNLCMPLDDEHAARGGVVQTKGALVAAVARELDLAIEEVRSAEVIHRSIDARRKNDIHFVVTAQVTLASRQAEQAAVEAKRATVAEPLCELAIPSVVCKRRPLVVGAGPAGLFCALYLAYAGARPLVIEQGAAVEERVRVVDAFNAGAALDAYTNVQFGEGGAGTFSDGKLNTGTKHHFTPYVLQWFVDAGAPPEILWESRPHIGSDLLPLVVRSLRERIIALGGEVRFHTRLVDIAFEHGHVRFATLCSHKGEKRRIPVSALVLATGHSARAVYDLLARRRVVLERKPFAMGVRIEHRQEAINRGQWGRAASHPALAGQAADYKMAVHVSDTRSAFTFCMCPGGTVVAAASEEGGVVTNGMSSYARDGKRANAALLVNVDPADIPGTDPLAGVHLQREIEKRAYEAGLAAGGGPYSAPAQTVGSFLASQTDSTEALSSLASYPLGVVPCDLHTILPDFICDTLAFALPRFDSRLQGFSDPSAVMTAPESRSSSPVRIVRDDRLQALLSDEALPPGMHSGLFPCGEGAGYAGGIVSAAADGMRVAATLVQDLQIESAARALRAGRVALFPTDTVVGLGVAVKAAADPTELYRLKRRDVAKPIAWLIAQTDDLATYGTAVPAYAFDLARTHWPGALTLIVRASDCVPRPFVSREGTIALRVPASSCARALIAQVGCPLATTSANIAGRPAVRTTGDLDERLRACSAALVESDGTRQPSGIASTVVDCTGEKPFVCRQGSVVL